MPGQNVSLNSEHASQLPGWRGAHVCVKTSLLYKVKIYAYAFFCTWPHPPMACGPQMVVHQRMWLLGYVHHSSSNCMFSLHCYPAMCLFTLLSCMCPLRSKSHSFKWGLLPGKWVRIAYFYCSVGCLSCDTNGTSCTNLAMECLFLHVYLVGMMFPLALITGLCNC